MARTHKWVRAAIKAYGPDAKMRDDDAPADGLSMRKRIVVPLEALTLAYAEKDEDTRDRLFSRTMKLERHILAVPAASLRGIALKLRVALRDTRETYNPILTILVLDQVLPVLGRMEAPARRRRATGRA